MYIKIKNPDRSALLVQLFALGLLLSAVIICVLIFAIMAGSIDFLWKQAKELFYWIQQEKGIFTAVFCVLATIMIPVGFVAGIIDWFRKRRQWNNPQTVYGIDFGLEGATLYSQARTQFFPYKDTCLVVDTSLGTVRTKDGSYPTVTALTFSFKQEEGPTYDVRHKPDINLLYRLVGFHSYFKQLSFTVTPSSLLDRDQTTLANFLKEQLENHRLYGIHCRYRVLTPLIVGIVLFFILSGIMLFVLCFVLFPDPDFWLILLITSALLCFGFFAIKMLCSCLRDVQIRKQLKKLRRSN